MLNSISWQQYFTAIIALSVAWYLFVGLRFYQPEVQAFFKIKPQIQTVTPPLASIPSVVLGKINPDVDTDIYNADQLTFSDSTSDDISDQTLPKGPADDLLAEAETLIMAYQDNNDKTGFLSLLKVLFSKYEVFAEEISLSNVITILKKSAKSKLSFALTDAEWPLTF
jgi:hypothetical protein